LISVRLTVFLALLAFWPAAALADPALAVGQVWSIKATPPSPVQVLIGRIEPYGEGHTVVSVALTGVPTAHGPVPVGHLPFDKDALVASLGDLLATDQPIPSTFEAGYQQWKDAHGGVFTLPVDKVVAILQAQIAAHPDVRVQ
jgi:hypothetical protein